jgi:hypothetical protein
MRAVPGDNKKRTKKYKFKKITTNLSFRFSWQWGVRKDSGEMVLVEDD